MHLSHRCVKKKSFIDTLIKFLFQALVSLTPLPRNTSREDIECPGVTIPFNCSVQSNTETIHLIWRVTIPGQLPLNITYDGSSAVNMDTELHDFIVSSLDTVRVDYIEAFLEFTVNTNIDFNSTTLECLIQGLGNESATLYINASRKSVLSVSPSSICPAVSLPACVSVYALVLSSYEYHSVMLCTCMYR